jgi:SSS family solute:Na+ symporter
VIEYEALAVFVALFLVVTVVGFMAARWRSGDLNLLEEWGLAGRKFGTVITWFLLGGDLYTAYTFIAVPAVVFGSGAIGFFAVPYTIMVYPLVFAVMPRLWRIAKERGHITPADFVRDHFDSQALALIVAVTGIVATMPYIALQIYGIQVVLSQMGIPVEVSLIVAFLVLAVFTYLSGLRAPALIALVKDALIYVTVLVAVIYIPIKLGGYGAIFQKVPAAKLTLAPAAYISYSTLALGSALALFLYPHALIGVFSSRSANAIRRNAALLPAYSLVLGLLATLGWMAIAAGLHPKNANQVIPLLFDRMFPGWFAGFAFAAVAIGALVPASVMSIAAANLFNRNIWQPYVHRHESPREESRVSRIVSLLVKVGALIFILIAPAQFAITFQLAGGVLIVQTLPAVILALYVGWLHRYAVIAGWVAGTAWGVWMLIDGGYKSSALYALHLPGLTTGKLYIGLTSVILNLVVVLVGSGVMSLIPRGSETRRRPVAA